MAQTVKNVPAIRSLCWEDPLENGLPAPVFLSGEFRGQRLSPWGRRESDVTERLTLQLFNDRAEKDLFHPAPGYR